MAAHAEPPRVHIDITAATATRGDPNMSSEDRGFKPSHNGDPAAPPGKYISFRDLKGSEVWRKVVWLVNAVSIGKSSLSLGICEESKRVAFVAPESGRSSLAPLIIHDLYIDALGCEEGERCLVLNCGYNRTNYTSFKRSSSWARKSLERKRHFLNLVGIVRECESLLAKEIEKIDWAGKATVHMFERPPLKVGLAAE